MSEKKKYKEPGTPSNVLRKILTTVGNWYSNNVTKFGDYTFEMWKEGKFNSEKERIDMFFKCFGIGNGRKSVSKKTPAVQDELITTKNSIMIHADKHRLNQVKDILLEALFKGVLYDFTSITETNGKIKRTQIENLLELISYQNIEGKLKNDENNEENYLTEKEDGNTKENNNDFLTKSKLSFNEDDNKFFFNTGDDRINYPELTVKEILTKIFRVKNYDTKSLMNRKIIKCNALKMMTKFNDLKCQIYNYMSDFNYFGSNNLADDTKIVDL